MSEREVSPEDYGAAAFMLRIMRDSGKGLSPEQVEDLIPVLQSAARLQRVVDDLADALRSVSRQAWNASEEELHAKVRFGVTGIARTAERHLQKHGLWRPCDDPAQVPSAMRAEVD